MSTSGYLVSKRAKLGSIDWTCFLVIIWHRNICVCLIIKRRRIYWYFLAILEERTEREIAERDLNDDRYQTAEGEENVEATGANDLEQSDGLVEVIETSNVTQRSSFFLSSTLVLLDRFRYRQ